MIIGEKQGVFRGRVSPPPSPPNNENNKNNKNNTPGFLQGCARKEDMKKSRERFFHRRKTLRAIYLIDLEFIDFLKSFE